MFHYLDSQNSSAFALVSKFIRMIIEKLIKTSLHLHLTPSSFYNCDNICKQLTSKIHF